MKEKKSKLDEFDFLVEAARKLGASSATLIDPAEIVIDRRVRLKCAIPRCSSYGVHLMCPPNVMPIEEFEKTVRAYRMALIVQIEAPYDSADKSSAGLSGTLCEELEESIGVVDCERKLHTLVNDLERMAFKNGYYLAAGLIGGDCSLCPECIGIGNGPCRHPFEARSSMEAMGIDVIRTCEKAGMNVSLSSKNKVHWTGLILLD